MRLVAFEFADAQAPVAAAYLEFGDVTVLFGPNDVGKSRLLQTVADGARSLDLLIGGQPTSGDHRFFVEFGDADADRLLSATYERHRAEVEEVEDLPREADGRTAWLGMTEGHKRDDLKRSSLFALEALADWCGKPPAGPPGLLVSWCTSLEPLAGVHFFGSAGTRIGTIDLPVLPMPVHVPSSEPRWLRRELSDAVGSWLAHVLWGLSAVQRLETLGEDVEDTDRDSMDDWYELAEGFARRVERRPPAEQLWTVRDEDSGSVAYRPIAATACSHVSELATRLAPSFVRERYRITARPRDILDWSPEEPIVVVLESVADGSAFDHSDLADGLRLWVEISLLEAADAMRRAELRLRDALLALQAVGPHDDLALARAARVYVDLLHEFVEVAVDPPFERTLAAAFNFASGVESPWMDDDTSPSLTENLAAVRPRLYLLDEPERHLNPRLQRAAAAWLVDLLRTRGSQGLIATHAPAFLNAGPDTHYIQIRRRDDDRSELVPFAPEEVTAYSEIATEVGLDRGELLGNIEVLLFVEGRHDQAVLETVFSSRFRHAGVVVVPIAGAGKHAQIVEHEVLIRFTRARLAVVLDKLNPEVVRRLLDDAEFRHESLRSRQTELQAMASLLQNAVRNKRQVQPFALPVDDIFDALDEGVIKDQFPRYPGHVQARALWDGQSKVRNRKLFYEERFGITNDVETYRKLAALMGVLGRIPGALDELAIAVEFLALGER